MTGALSHSKRGLSQQRKGPVDNRELLANFKRFFKFQSAAHPFRKQASYQVI